MIDFKNKRSEVLYFISLAIAVIGLIIAFSGLIISDLDFMGVGILVMCCGRIGTLEEKVEALEYERENRYKSLFGSHEVNK